MNKHFDGNTKISDEMFEILTPKKEDISNMSNNKGLIENDNTLEKGQRTDKTV